MHEGESMKSFVQVQGLHLHLTQWGQAGEPFLLLHGLASTRHMFDLVAPLLDDTFTLYAPDQRGHGESDKPATGYDFDTICADLDGLADALGLTGSFRLAGHSWGAYTALHYAATRPDRVSRLFLIDGGVAAIRDRFGATWEETEAKMAPHSFEGVNR
jgi:pimeloyl-ACP methyl ester carboxylesterase